MAARSRATKLMALGVLFVSACRGGDQEPEPKYPPAQNKKGVDGARIRALDSVRLADVPAGTFGPYFADTQNGTVVAWAALSEKSRSWWSLRIDAKGAPTGKPIKLANAPSEVGLAIVEPKKAHDDSGGFVLLYTRRDAKKTAIEALALGPTGAFQGGPRTVGDVDGDVIWIDVVPTASGPLAFWGVRRDAGADLFVAPLDSSSRGGREVVRGARAWQAASGDVAMLGTLSDKRVEVTAVDTTGNPGRRVTVSESATAEPDLDLVSAGDGLLLAWSDRKDLDVRVVVAAVDAHGKLVRPPSPAVSGLGEQALVRLVAPLEGRGPAYLAWENLQERPAQGRAIQLATVLPDGSVGDSRVELRHAASDSLPELTSTANGLGALTLAAACKKGGECSIAPLVPTFVELDRSLEIKSSEPVRLTALGGEAPDLAWGLSCVRSPCSMLAAQSSDPAPIYSVRLRSGQHEYVPAAARIQKPSPPRAATLETIGAGDPMADVASAKVGNNTLAAWVTYFDPSAPPEKPKKPAPDGKLEAVRALLQVRSLAEANRPAAETLSIRARSLGGVAISAGASGATDAMVGWTAIDNKLPQVFVTLVDANGKKVRQRMLTRAPGEKTDVALAGIGDGWVAAWVDERGGDPEIYAAKVNRMMQSAGPERRITNVAGAASGVALLARDDRAILVWSDARDAVRPGWADLYATTLKGADASASAPEAPIAKTPLHSHSPALAPFGKGALLAWIEAAPKDAGGSGDGEVAVVELDAAARPVGNSTRIKALNGAATAVSVDCAADRCRVAFAVAAGDHAELESVTWTNGKATTPVRLVTLTGPAGTAVAPALSGRELVFADKSLEQGRVRRLLVDWE